MRDRCLFLLFLVLAAELVPGPASGQDYAAAGRHFAAAQDAFEKKDYRRAAAEFQAAYDITRDPVLLYNIGESLERAGDRAGAIASYRAYLKEQPQAADRKEVERRLLALEALGPAPPAAPLAAAPKAPAPGPRPGPPAVSPYRTAAWASVAAGVAILTAGAVLGLGAQNRADELERRTTLTSSGGVPPVYSAGEDELYRTLTSEGRAYNSAAIACFTVAGAVAVTSGVLFLLDWRRQRAQARERTSARAFPAVSPLQSAGEGSGVRWSF
jgi:tetratricopeptide (TPR) repeat protein